MKWLVCLLMPLSLFSQSGSVLILNTHIVDVLNGKILDSQFVLVEGNRISRISSEQFESKNEVVIDGKGKYLMPGLCDFNAEILNYEHSGVHAFSLMLANG